VTATAKDATPVLETGRLVLRPPEASDLDQFAAVVSDPDVVRFIGSGRPATPDAAAATIERDLTAWRKDGFGRFAVIRREDERFIGRVGLLAWDPVTWTHSTRTEIGERAEIEIGWTLARDAWGNGYATEAALAVRDWAFREIRPRRLISLIHPENDRSKRVAEKLGERHERDVVVASGNTAELWTT
jgi:RimJ/RimL family protein N-acetyltransferase